MDLPVDVTEGWAPTGQITLLSRHIGQSSITFIPSSLKASIVAWQSPCDLLDLGSLVTPSMTLRFFILRSTSSYLFMELLFGHSAIERKKNLRVFHRLHLNCSIYPTDAPKSLISVLAPCSYNIYLSHEDIGGIIMGLNYPNDSFWFNPHRNLTFRCLLVG